MLIKSPRHTEDDLRRWVMIESMAEIQASMKSHRTKIRNAESALLNFIGVRADCYCGVSWGKDSVVVADMVIRLCPRVPLVWIRVEPRKNPDCLLVRDEFLKRFPSARYEEISVECTKDDAGWHAQGTLERGFEIAKKRFGARHISGIRSNESADRARRVSRWGESTVNTCAPIARFEGMDVFAYLLSRGLPVHPAYACTMSGAFAHERIRVATLGGKRGDGHGRAAWEWQYYEQELHALGYSRYDVRPR